MEQGPWRKLRQTADEKEREVLVPCSRCEKAAVFIRSWRGGGMTAPAFEYGCKEHGGPGEEPRKVAPAPDVLPDDIRPAETPVLRLVK